MSARDCERAQHPCDTCTALHVPDQLNPMADCAFCGEPTAVQGDDGYCDDCRPEPEPEDDMCPTCAGSGMPSSGPPDVGCCRDCRGSGVRRAPREPDSNPGDYDLDDRNMEVEW